MTTFEQPPLRPSITIIWFAVPEPDIPLQFHATAARKNVGLNATATGLERGGSRAGSIRTALLL